MDSSVAITSLSFLGFLLSANITDATQDSDSYYSSKCPRATSIIKEQVDSILKQNKNLAGAFLRMHFHDCFVRGCDASILLSSGERSAIANAQLRGFEQIQQIKSALEAECPGIVSCADIVALAARDATVNVGGPSWYVKLGRRDGLVSLAIEADAQLPSALMTFDQLVVTFALKGLTSKEMVVLSGGHTIGRSTCTSVKPRLYDFLGLPGATDPTIDSSFAADLKKKCPLLGDGSILSMDSTKDTFDYLYFKAIVAGKGLFVSDAQLLASPVGQVLVNQYSKPGSSFPSDFAAAMVKLSTIGWGSLGQVRKTCSDVN